MTIGIECHIQLATASKLFSPANNDSRDAAPNTNVHEIDFGLPGMLPILNREAVNLAIKAAKVLNAEVAKVSRFDRKHYFYPDLPKGYQTTQMYQPIILSGYIDAPLENSESVHVRIHHAHMEEDAGKLTHYSDYSLVDLNRAGTPLIEIVSEPDMHSPAQARAFATELHLLMVHAGVTNGDLYHGNMRFDVNVSVAKKGSTELGKRAEVKNLNSFRSVEKAAEYEFKRQVELIEAGGGVVQETRGWNDDKMITTSQRSKEDAQDYRYMPDADIPPIILTQQMIDDVQKGLPMLPSAYREMIFKDKGLDTSVINKILADKNVSVMFARIDDKHIKRVANWFGSAVSQEDVSSEIVNFSPVYYEELSQMVEEGKLSSTNAKEVFNELLSRAVSPAVIAEEKNLIQVSDESDIIEIVEQVLSDKANQKAVEDVKSGNDKVIGFLVGQVMKKSAGKANPALAQKLLRQRL